MNDEQFFLANAYLDGELTADERRIAEADPEVMSEVGSLRALRDELRDVPEPDPAAREAAIAAAMGEFHVGAAATGTERATAEPSVVPFRPRPQYAKYLAVAAALVAVAGLGIVISQAGGGDDDAGGDDAASVEDAPLAETAARDENLTAIAEGATEEATAEQPAEAESAPTAAADSDAAADAELMEEAGDDSAGESGAEPAFGADESESRIFVPPDFDPEAPILSEIGLAIYGAYLLEQQALDLLGPTPETRCDGDGDAAVLDTAVYVLDGDARPVYVAVDEIEGNVLALDADTCTELARGDLF